MFLKYGYLARKKIKCIRLKNPLHKSGLRETHMIRKLFHNIHGLNPKKCTKYDEVVKLYNP